MTISIVAKINKGLILTSYSRYYHGEVTSLGEHLLQLNEFTGIMVSGDKELASNLLEELSKEIRERKIEFLTQELIAITQNIFSKGYNEYINRKNPEVPPLYCVLAGCNPQKEPKVYFLSYPDFQPVPQLLGESGACAISADEQSRDLIVNNTLSYFTTLFRKCNMNLQESNLHQLAMMFTFALDSAVKANGELEEGGQIRVATVEANGTFMFPNDIQDKLASYNQHEHHHNHHHKH